MTTFVLILSLLLQFFFPGQLQSQDALQTAQPPDLLISSHDTLSLPGITLQRIDVRTQTATTFYKDDSAFRLDLLGWSPNGDYLAVLRASNTTRSDLCIVDREGNLRLCFDDVVSINALSDYERGRGDNQYWFSWSSTGESIYFVEEDDLMLHIVEGNITTGEISLPLYSYSKADFLAYPALYGDMLHNQILVFHDLDYGPSFSFQDVTIVDLETGESTELNRTLPDYRHHVISPCPGVSPQQGLRILTAYAMEDGPLPRQQIFFPTLLLVDAQNTIIHSLDTARLAHININHLDCPVWQPDEERLFFLGYRYDPLWTEPVAMSLYRYSPSTDELAEITSIEMKTPWRSRPVIAPDGTAAIKFFDYDKSELTFIFPDGTVSTLTADSVLGNPIWFPPERQPEG